MQEETEISQTGSDVTSPTPTCIGDDASSQDPASLHHLTSSHAAAAAAHQHRSLHHENWDNPFSHLSSHHHHHHHHHMHHPLKEEESSSSFQSIHEELNHSIFNIYRPLQLF